MSVLKITLPAGETITEGKRITFRAPCDCTAITSLLINNTSYILVDAMGNTRIAKNEFKNGHMVTITLDTVKKYAVLPSSSADLETHTSNKSNPHGVTKSQVGLGNVDNTSDANKSVKYAATSGTANAVAWTAISGKPSSYTPTTHSHTKEQITDFPSSMPASDVYSWAKEKTKPEYTASEVGASPVGHRHNCTDITNLVDILNVTINYINGVEYSKNGSVRASSSSPYRAVFTISFEEYCGNGAGKIAKASLENHSNFASAPSLTVFDDYVQISGNGASSNSITMANVKVQIEPKPIV